MATPMVFAPGEPVLGLRRPRHQVDHVHFALSNDAMLVLAGESSKEFICYRLMSEFTQRNFGHSKRIKRWAVLLTDDYKDQGNIQLIKILTQFLPEDPIIYFKNESIPQPSLPSLNSDNQQQNALVTSSDNLLKWLTNGCLKTEDISLVILNFCTPVHSYLNQNCPYKQVLSVLRKEIIKPRIVGLMRLKLVEISNALYLKECLVHVESIYGLPVHLSSDVLAMDVFGNEIPMETIAYNTNLSDSMPTAHNCCNLLKDILRILCGINLPEPSKNLRKLKAIVVWLLDVLVILGLWSFRYEFKCSQRTVESLQAKESDSLNMLVNQCCRSQFQLIEVLLNSSLNVPSLEVHSQLVYKICDSLTPYQVFCDTPSSQSEPEDSKIPTNEQNCCVAENVEAQETKPDQRHPVNNAVSIDSNKITLVLKSGKLNSKVRFCCIIVTTNTCLAKMLSKQINYLSSNNEKYSFLKSGCITQSSKKRPETDNKAEEILSAVQQGVINVIVTTKDLSDHLVVSPCSVLVYFDMPESYAMYLNLKKKARGHASKFVVVVREKEMDSSTRTLQVFMDIEGEIKKRVSDFISIKKKERWLKCLAQDCLPSYAPSGEDGPQVAMISAIHIINRYCLRLSKGNFSNLCAQFITEKNDVSENTSKVSTTLCLPFGCSCQQVIKGPAIHIHANDDFDVAILKSKMAASLEGVKLLHTSGNMDDDLELTEEQIGDPSNEERMNCELEDEGKGRAGTNKRKRAYEIKVPSFYKDDMPIANKPLFLYKIELGYPKNLKSSEIEQRPDPEIQLGILSRKPLPRIPKFTIYTTEFDITVSITPATSGGDIFLDDDNLKLLREFHKYVFQDLFKFNPQSILSEEDGYLIAPVKPTTAETQIHFPFLEKFQLATNECNNSETVQECQETAQECQETVQECQETVQECQETVQECQDTVQCCHETVQECQETVQECQETVQECQETVQECQETVQDCQETVQECQDTVQECQETVQDCQETVQDCQETVQECQDTVQECQETVQDCQETVQECQDTVQCCKDFSIFENTVIQSTNESSNKCRLVKFLVSEVCKDLNPGTAFPNLDVASTFAEYYLKRYRIKLNPDQPLLRVKYASGQVNFLFPRCASNEGKQSEDGGASERSCRTEIHLIPELCSIFPISASAWKILSYLPTIVYRLSTFLLAEELRCLLQVETGIGCESWPEEIPVPELGIGGSVGEDRISQSSVRTSDVLDESVLDTRYQDLSIGDSEGEERLNSVSQGCVGTPGVVDESISGNQFQDLDTGDIKGEERLNSVSKGCVGTPGVLGVSISDNQDNRMNSPSLDKPGPSGTNDYKLPSPTTSPNIGPCLTLILRTLTAKSAGLYFHSERLELLGDTVLKLEVSVELFLSFPEKDEWALSVFRGFLVSNDMLSKRGRLHGLPGFITINLPDILKNSLAPGFTLDENSTTPSFVNGGNEGRDVSLTTYRHQVLGDKHVANCVEALIGAYVISCGRSSARRVMIWLGVLNKTPEELKSLYNTVSQNTRVSRRNPKIFSRNCDLGQDSVFCCSSPESYPDPELCRIEEEIGYHFKTKHFLLIALTHTSYPTSLAFATESYQRLEFLGDAVLDYLVTFHLYSRFPHLNHGDLTDFRSALVNNFTFAFLAVQNGLHQSLRYMSPPLMNVMGKFVDFLDGQGEKQGESWKTSIDAFVVGNSDVDEISIEVPKVLGDIFESLVGAVFLDCGMNIDLVWCVFYPMLQPFIDYYKDNIPRSPVRTLQEMFPEQVTFSLARRILSKNYVCGVHVVDYGSFQASGRTSKIAKASVARKALQHIRNADEIK